MGFDMDLVRLPVKCGPNANICGSLQFRLTPVWEHPGFASIHTTGGDKLMLIGLDIGSRDANGTAALVAWNNRT